MNQFMLNAGKRYFCRAMILAGALMMAAGGAWAADEDSQPVAPEKFIPSFAIKYSTPKGWPALEDAARYDVLVAGAGAVASKAHQTIPGNTWQVLKKLNPRQVILVYEIGPAEYNTADWGRLGDGWEWIMANHGPGSADRWVALGAQYGVPLQSKPYPKERMMLPGKPGWQQYWLDSVYAKHWGEGARPGGVPADGLFSDNTRYDLIWEGNWRREKHPDTVDIPADYAVDGKVDKTAYHRDMKSFFGRAFPWMKGKGLKLCLNFGHMSRGPEPWVELDNEPAAPFAAMEEGAFVHPWGVLGRADNYDFYPEKEWLNQVESMRSLKHVRALMTVHAHPKGPEDMGRMETRDVSGMNGWDALWFAMTSFLQGYDDARQNALLNFTLWGYGQFYWLDEFDPQYLHLGKAKGEYRKVEGREGHVYVREFEDGWAVVNPTTKQAAGVAVPQGEARVVTHENMKQPESGEAVKAFDLASRRGIVLLKPGRAIGNGDNK